MMLISEQITESFIRFVWIDRSEFPILGIHLDSTFFYALHRPHGLLVPTEYGTLASVVFLFLIKDIINITRFGSMH